MTMPMRWQKSNRLEKQQLCMCIMLFCTLTSLLSLHDFDVKMPNYMFNGGHKQWTTNFLSLSKLQCSPQEINSWKICLHLTLSAINKVRQNVYSFQKWCFSCCRCPLCYSSILTLEIVTCKLAATTEYHALKWYFLMGEFSVQVFLWDFLNHSAPPSQGGFFLVA